MGKRKNNFTVIKQAAFEYVLYMIAASYFESAECSTGTTERKLLLRYKEQKAKSQYMMEDFCISFMDKFAERVGADLFRRAVEARIVRERQDRPMSIIFSGEGFRMSFCPVYAGKRSVIRYSVKNAAA